MGRRQSRSERRAAGRRRAASGSRSGQRPARGRMAGLGLLVVGLSAAAWFWSQREPAAPPAPPAGAVRVSADGVRIATLDLELLNQWCRDQALPEPPGMPETEGEFAAELLTALHAAATHRTAAAYGKVGMICESVDAHAAGLAYFDLAIRTDARDFRWPYYQACIYQVTGRPEEAARSLRRSVELEPTYAISYARLGQLELETGQVAAADSLFRQYTLMQPGDWLGLVGSARVALRRGDPASALALLTQATGRGGADFQVHRLLGRVHGALGDRERAAEHFDRAAALPQGAWYRSRDPLDETLHQSASSVTSLENEFQRQSASGDWPRLAALAEEILRRRSEDVTMLGNLAGLYRKMERYDDANRVLDQAFAVGTDALRLHNLRAEVRLAQADYAGALDSANAARTLDPDSARVAGVRARALFMLERFDEARQSMERCLEIAPDDPGNLLVMGEIHLQLGDLNAAESAYRSVLQFTEHPLARQRIAEMGEEGR